MHGIIASSLILLSGSLSPVLGAGCAADVVDIRNSGASLRFQVEVADDPQERSKGLMFRETLGRYAGMLFVYDRPQRAGFWMKNTLIPLDMLFIDSTGTVTRIHENAIPHDTTMIDGGRQVFAVLEINGGLSRKLRITPGAQVRHPAFAENEPVWPCE